MKKIYIFLLFSLLHSIIYGQEIFIMKYEVSRLNMQLCVPKDSTHLEQSRLTVNYRFSQVVNHSVDSLRWNVLSLQIGKNYYKQKDMRLYYAAMRYILHSDDDKDKLSFLSEQSGNAPSNLFVDMLYSKQQKDWKVVCGDFFKVDAPKMYIQKETDLHWDLLDDDEEMIASYPCHKAITNYSGKQWVAWYTLEIPVDAGPWKLKGLPGLILKATDNQCYNFECLEVRQEKMPIYNYVYKPIQRLNSFSDYYKYERNFHEHPYEILGNGRDVTIITSDRNGKPVFHDKTWSIPYNPIEVE